MATVFFTETYENRHQCLDPLQYPFLCCIFHSYDVTGSFALRIIVKHPIHERTSTQTDLGEKKQ